jgi:hypothetical protein
MWVHCLHAADHVDADILTGPSARVESAEALRPYTTGISELYRHSILIEARVRLDSLQVIHVGGSIR